MVCILEHEIVYDEGNLGAKELTVFKVLDVAPEQDVDSCKLPPATLMPPSRTKRPLTSSREYYLPAFCNEDICGEVWNSPQIKSHKLTKTARFWTASHLQLRGASQPKPHLPVVGWVVDKTRVIHYAKTSKTEKYPLQFQIEIVEDGCSCSVTFWNSMCVKFFKTINVGDRILLKNYRLKRRYLGRSNTVYDLSQAAPVELSLNSRDPAGEVVLLDSVKTGHEVDYRFLSSKAVHLYPARKICDVVGVVSF